MILKVSEFCAECLYRKQKNTVSDEKYLRAVKEIIDQRKEDDTAPYLVYQFNELYEKMFHIRKSLLKEKKQYNDLALSMEAVCRKQILQAEDPIKEALMYARIGNYIDFGAMNQVDPDTFLQLFEKAEMSQSDLVTYETFLLELQNAKRFLLLADNCGEIVFDKLFLEVLKKRFPDIACTVLVRGGEVLNDATMEDAIYVGLQKEAAIISNETQIAGTVYTMIGAAAKDAFDNADVILAKGQGNYETLSQQGHHIFYAFLCKCDMFTDRFKVPRLTGIFLEEK